MPKFRVKGLYFNLVQWKKFSGLNWFVDMTYMFYLCWIAKKTNIKKLPCDHPVQSFFRFFRQYALSFYSLDDYIHKLFLLFPFPHIVHNVIVIWAVFDVTISFMIRFILYLRLIFYSFFLNYFLHCVPRLRGFSLWSPRFFQNTAARRALSPDHTVFGHLFLLHDLFITSQQSGYHFIMLFMFSRRSAAKLFGLIRVGSV